MATPFHRLEDCLGDGANDDQPIDHDLEVDFDAVGIAKCCQCGVKLPANHAAIEAHSRDCVGVPLSRNCVGEPSGRYWNPDLEAAENAWWGVSKPSPSGMLTDGETTLDHRDASSGLSAEADPDDDAESFVMHTEVPETLLDDWEDDLDAIGIAKCSHCGAKLPLNDEAIEEHLKQCEGEGRRRPRRPLVSEQQVQKNFGNCCRCNQRISLEVDDVIAHSQVCPALRPSPDRRAVARTGAQTSSSWLYRWASEACRLP